MDNPMHYLPYTHGISTLNPAVIHTYTVKEHRKTLIYIVIYDFMLFSCFGDKLVRLGKSVRSMSYKLRANNRSPPVPRNRLNCLGVA